MTNLPAIFEGLPSLNGLWDKLHFKGNALEIVGTLTLDESRECVRYFAGAHEIVTNVCRWALADLLLYGERKWGELYDDTELGYHYLMNLKSAAKAFPPERRRNLSIGHHEAVRTLPEEYQDELLDLAEKNKWGRDTLRDIVKQIKGEKPAMVKVLASWKEDVLELLHQMVTAAVNGRVDVLLELAHKGKELIT